MVVMLRDSAVLHYPILLVERQYLVRSQCHTAKV